MKTSYYFHFKIASDRARIAGHSDWVPAIIYITANIHLVSLVGKVPVYRVGGLSLILGRNNTHSGS